jgi:hypothetical protein
MLHICNSLDQENAFVIRDVTGCLWARSNHKFSSILKKSDKGG